MATIKKHIEFWIDAVKDRKNKKYLPFHKYWYYAFRLYLYREPVKVVHISRFARNLFYQQWKNSVIIKNKAYCKWGLLLAGFELEKGRIEYPSFAILKTTPSED